VGEIFLQRSCRSLRTWTDSAAQFALPTWVGATHLLVSDSTELLDSLVRRVSLEDVVVLVVVVILAVVVVPSHCYGCDARHFYHSCRYLVADHFPLSQLVHGRY